MLNRWYIKTLYKHLDYQNTVIIQHQLARNGYIQEAGQLYNVMDFLEEENELEARNLIRDIFRDIASNYYSRDTSFPITPLSENQKKFLENWMKKNKKPIKQPKTLSDKDLHALIDKALDVGDEERFKMYTDILKNKKEEYDKNGNAYFTL